MNRKWSDRVNSKHLSKALAGLAGFSILTAVFFQNCTPVNVHDMTEEERLLKEHIAYVGAGEAIVEVGASQYDKSSAGFDVGLDSVPPLKQFWIVDNSGTMDANNLNLSNSFGAMFNQNNQDSLFKFDTTAYLLSTAQTIPSYSSSSKSVVTDIASRQSVYLGPNSVTESDFNSIYRTAALNSGQIPGDNVGISVKATSTTDFTVTAAPVLGKAPGSTFSLSSSIRKPRNTNTDDFETDFQSRLSVLTSKRVPSSLVGGVDTQQSAAVIDKESGLCAMARVLDNPNGLYSNSDLLAFTVVTDENENDVSGLNCLKRTSYQKANVDLVNGRCSEFDTAFSYAQRNRDPYTCSVSGSAGYRADFSYLYNYATISYYAMTAAASVTSTTPQTKISWKTPTTKTTYEQQRTSIRYYTQRNVAATYKYEARRIPVTYYLPVCTKQIRDGIETTTCVAAASASNGFVEASNYTNCNAAARSLNSTSIIATTESIPASKLPTCQTAVWQVVASCTVGDGTNCRQTMLTPPSIVIDQGPIDTYLVGNRAGDCSAAAVSLNANAVTATSPNIAADKLPACQPAAWVTLTGSNTCVVSSTCRSSVSAGTPADGNSTVLGAIANASTACTGHSAVPANAIAGTVICAAATARTTSAACTPAETMAGCTSVSKPETKGMKSAGNIAGITSLSGCQDWVNGRSDNRTDASNPIVCDLKNENRKVSSTRTFVQVSNNSLQVGDACGATAVTFYNALSSGDKSLLGATGAGSDCKIGAINAGAASVRTLAAANCPAQLAADCSALNYRDCSSVPGGGGFTAAYSAPAPHSRIKMKDINCNSKCKDLPAGACEDSSGLDITFAQYLTNKLGSADKQIQCSSAASTELTPAIGNIVARPLSDSANFCASATDGTRRYFVQVGAAFRTEAYVDEFVAGNSEDGKSPKMDLIQFIKNKIESSGLNVNLTVFIRRSEDPNGVGGTGINYKGVDYEKLVQVLSAPNAQTGRAPASGQVYSVLAPSYSEALTSLSAELKSKLIRSFAISALKAYHVVTSVKITAPNGAARDLEIGQWTQSGQVITIANGIDIQEGDKISVQYQNDDGYIRAQLKKIFIIDQMRPEQIIKSVEHIQVGGGTVLLTQDQWLKDGNKIVIDPKLVINGGDRFRIKFKNDVAED